LPGVGSVVSDDHEGKRPPWRVSCNGREHLLGTRPQEGSEDRQV
jgi:hypothetical protein